jgi:hypothetical protein
MFVAKAIPLPLAVAGSSHSRAQILVITGARFRACPFPPARGCADLPSGGCRSAHSRMLPSQRVNLRPRSRTTDNAFDDHRLRQLWGEDLMRPIPVVVVGGDRAMTTVTAASSWGAKARCQPCVWTNMHPRPRTAASKRGCLCEAVRSASGGSGSAARRSGSSVDRDRGRAGCGTSTSARSGM